MSEAKSPPHGASVSGVVRTFRILQTIASREAMGLSEISRELRIHKSTVLRFLTTLCDLGYLRRRAGTETYTLSLKLFELGASALDHVDVVEESRQPLEWLATKTAETVHLAARESKAVVYLNKIDSPHSLRMYSRIGKLAPLHCTGLGKALLAWLPEETLQEIYGNTRLPVFTGNTIRNLSELRKELKRIRKAGYSWDHEEHEPGIRCVAAPVFDRSGAVCAALSVAWPTVRDAADTERIRAPLVIEAARMATLNLGGSPLPRRVSEGGRRPGSRLAALDGARSR